MDACITAFGACVYHQLVYTDTHFGDTLNVTGFLRLSSLPPLLLVSQLEDRCRGEALAAAEAEEPSVAQRKSVSAVLELLRPGPGGHGESDGRAAPAHLTAAHLLVSAIEGGRRRGAPIHLFLPLKMTRQGCVVSAHVLRLVFFVCVFAVLSDETLILLSECGPDFLEALDTLVSLIHFYLQLLAALRESGVTTF